VIVGDVIQIGGGEKAPAPDPMPQGIDRMIDLLVQAIGKVDRLQAAIDTTNALQTSIEVLLSALLNRSNAPQHLMFRWVRTPRDAAHAAALRHLALEIADALAKQH
jgi:hypothetical protein